MKKMLLALLMAAMMAFPFAQVVLAQPAAEEVLAPLAYTPGDVPAQTGAVEAMAPAIHAALLAMLNQDAAVFDAEDPMLGWECLYNMLSMYGQMDDRSDYVADRLLLPAEAVMDYAAALFDGVAALGPLPQALADRMVYVPDSDSYLLVCGTDALAELNWNTVEHRGGKIFLSGTLVYVAEGKTLAEFECVLSSQDTMFGYSIAQLKLV